MDLQGVSALVTGAASGIGAAAARQLGAAGAKVVVADLQADKGGALADEIGGVFVEVDVTAPSRSRRPSRQAVELGTAAGGRLLGRHRPGAAHDRARRRVRVGPRPRRSTAASSRST